MGKSILSFAAVALAAALPATAHAGAAWEFDTASESFSNGSWDFANRFTVVNAVTVSGLGWYADPFTGNVDANPVSLWSCDTAGCLTSGTLLAQAVVDNTYPVLGHFRYVTIPNLLLAPGEYLIGGVSDSNNYTWNNVNFATDPNIVYNDNRWFSTGSGASPTFNTIVQNDVSDGYWGPNLFLGAPTFAGGVPEPSTWAMMLLGFGLVGGAMRKSRQNARVNYSFA